jgi:hypothetical protein
VRPDDPLLDRRAIEEAFRRLGDRLARRGVVADIYVFGGAAMALAYDSRRATRDIDAVFQPHGVVLEAARAVAGELGLPAWWLNEQASVNAWQLRPGVCCQALAAACRWVGGAGVVDGAARLLHGRVSTVDPVVLGGRLSGRSRPRRPSPWQWRRPALAIAGEKPARAGQSATGKGLNLMIESLPRKTAAAVKAAALIALSVPSLASASGSMSRRGRPGRSDPGG